MFEAVKMDHQGRVGAMAPPKPALAGREGSVNLPEVNDFSDMYPDPDFSENLEKH